MNHILFDCERMKYANTGLFSYCYQLGSRLKQQIDPSSETLSFYTPPQIEGVFGPQYSYISQHSLHKFWLPSLRGYTIWHSTYQGSHYLPVLNRRIKTILTIHDLNFLYDQKKSDQKKKKYLSNLQKNIDRSEAVVCISEFCRKDVLSHCRIGNKPLVVIHNGTNRLEQPVLLGNSYRPRTRFLFSIGVVNRKKNFHVLLPLLRHNRDMELLIAGPPDDLDYVHYIKAAARELGVEEKLSLLGTISEAEKSWYYQNCYAFTFPSLSEGFGLPVTEAMSVGKPLFLSDRTALPEIGKDVAFYFPDFSEHQMQRTFLNGMKQYETDDMKEQIKKRSTEFCWRKAAASYIELYRSLY
ncbi:MAG TPA: glycosyltransferase family 1 protein [Flavisolibacter sp.]|nr:glycosyltransferase family 1 protein [Flavisolibacter sp.]